MVTTCISKEVKVGEKEEEGVKQKWKSVIGGGHDHNVSQVSPKLMKIHFNKIFLKNTSF